MIEILWHMGPLLGNGREINNETITIAMQQLRKYATALKQLLSSGPRATMEVLLEASEDCSIPALLIGLCKS
jgi:hypothetical protein